MEIEKKYLIGKLPDLSTTKCIRTEQHYICLSEKREVRIRKKGNKHFVTVKSGGMLERGEWESEISKEAYGTLIPASIGSVIKDRYEFKLPNNMIAEIDIYRGSLEGPDHLTVEVEFGSKDEAIAFKEPDWFGEDITADARYKNKNLATDGWPNKS